MPPLDGDSAPFFLQCWRVRHRAPSLEDFDVPAIVDGRLDRSRARPPPGTRTEDAEHPPGEGIPASFSGTPQALPPASSRTTGAGPLSTTRHADSSLSMSRSTPASIVAESTDATGAASTTGVAHTPLFVAASTGTGSSAARTPAATRRIAVHVPPLGVGVGRRRDIDDEEGLADAHGDVSLHVAGARYRGYGVRSWALPTAVPAASAKEEVDLNGWSRRSPIAPGRPAGSRPG